MNTFLKATGHFVLFLLIGAVCALINGYIFHTDASFGFVCGFIGGLAMDYLIYKYREQ